MLRCMHGPIEESMEMEKLEAESLKHGRHYGLGCEAISSVH